MKTVLITGASRGIGEAIASHFQQRDYRVIKPSRAEADLSDPDSVTAFLARCEDQIDILINNAGLNIITEISDFTTEAWNQMNNVNLVSPILLTQFASHHMKQKQWGRILNVSSCYSLVTREGRSMYSASKAALNSFTRTSALEFAPFNILVNAVCPGFIETDMTHQNNSAEQISAICDQIPLGRFAQPEEIAHIVGFLCSEENTYITGQSILADGGFVCR